MCEVYLVGIKLSLFLVTFFNEMRDYIHIIQVEKFSQLCL